MNRRCRFAVALVTLAMHLLAPVAAYAAPASPSTDYCSAATPPGVRSEAGLLAAPRAAQTVPGIPAPRSGHTPHSHCPSCFGVSLAIAVPAARTPLAVNLPALVRVANVSVHADPASQFALLPPLRGPPPIPV